MLGFIPQPNLQSFLLIIPAHSMSPAKLFFIIAYKVPQSLPITFARGR